MARIVIVGAGISGLATAWHLQQRLPQAAITVLEANARPGGTLWTERKQGFQVELGANGFLDNRGGTLRLCHALGLQKDLIPAAPSAKKRFLFHKDDLVPLPGGLASFLRSPLLSLRSKWRIATERYRKPRKDERDESVYDFIARRSSPEVAELLGDAFVTGIFAGDSRQLSVAAAFPRLVRAEREFGSVTVGLRRLNRLTRAELAKAGITSRKRPTMWSFKPGLRVLPEVLSVRLRREPLLGVPARAVRAVEDDGRPVWQVLAEGKEAFTADAVVLTCPAPRQAALLADQDPDLADQILHIPYASLAVVAVGYRQEDILRPIEGFGYLAPQESRRELLGVQYCSEIWPERAPAGLVLLRAMVGGWDRPEIMTWDDDRLSMAVRQELRMTLGILRPPVFMQIIRWDPAVPQYTLGHLERVAKIEDRLTQHPGLFLGGNAYHGISLNDCTENAERLAGLVAAHLQTRGLGS